SANCLSPWTNCSQSCGGHEEGVPPRRTARRIAAPRSSSLSFQFIHFQLMFYCALNWPQQNPGLFDHLVGANLPDLFRHSTSYVHKILQGAPPADLPV